MLVSPISPRTLAFSLSLLLALLAAPCLQAIEVTTTADENGDNPAACALREAVTAINGGTSFGGCAFVAGDSQVELAAETYVLSLELGVTDHVEISSPMTISGAGPGATIIERAAAFDGIMLRLDLDSAGTAILESLTVREGSTVGSAISATLGAGRNILLRDVVLRDNARGALSVGGASGSATLERVVVEENSRSTGSGGGLACALGSFDVPTMRLVDVVIRNNTAPSGGGLASIGCSLELTNVTFAGNTASSGGTSTATGGGLQISDYSGSPTEVSLTNVTFFGNSADSGGGLFQGASSTGNAFVTTLTNVTFAENTATMGGDHLFQNAASAGLRNVLFGPSAGSDCDGSPVPAFTLLGGNVDSDGSCGVEQTEAIPGLAGALSSHGGFAPMLGLAPGAAAIDAGTNSDCPATDQRGAPRPFDGDGDDVALCDAGAYEVSDIDVFSDGFEAGDASAWSDEVP